MKNWICTGLAAALLFAAGCGNEPQKTAPATDQPAAEQAPSSKAPKPAEHAVIEQKGIGAASSLDSIGPSKSGGNGSGMGSSSGSMKPKKDVLPMPNPAPVSVAPKRTVAGLDAAKWTDVADLEPSIDIDIRYATADNFTKSKIYDCPRCFLRPDAAEAIVKAHRKLQERGYGLKMFDCYRPRPYQQKLWDKVPNPDYVTPPQKGSMHSRGAAVDLTIVDKKGKELDMGTPYDFFGEKAHADCTDLPEKILANRKLLKTTMESVGFRGIRTEWWHFSFGKKEFDLSSEVWKCE